MREFVLLAIRGYQRFLSPKVSAAPTAPTLAGAAARRSGIGRCAVSEPSMDWLCCVGACTYAGLPTGGTDPPGLPAGRRSRNEATVPAICRVMASEVEKAGEAEEQPISAMAAVAVISQAVMTVASARTARTSGTSMCRRARPLERPPGTAEEIQAGNGGEVRGRAGHGRPVHGLVFVELPGHNDGVANGEAS